MNKKLQQSVLIYIRHLKEVSRDQVVNILSKKYDRSREEVQEAIHLLIDAKLISNVGMTTTLELTNKGHKALKPWYKKVNWAGHFKKMIFILIGYLLGLFSGEIKELIVNLIDK